MIFLIRVLKDNFYCRLHDKFNSFIYLDLNCFLHASTFASISFFIITSLSISVILIHFSETYFSFAWFINWQTWFKKYGKCISFGIISTALFIFSVSNSCNSFFVVSSYFSSFLLFIFLFLVFLLIFSISLSITVSMFFYFFWVFYFSWVWHFYICQKNRKFFFMIYISCDLEIFYFGAYITPFE